MTDDKTVPEDVMERVRERTEHRQTPSVSGPVMNRPVEGPPMDSPVVSHYQEKLNTLQEQAAFLTKEFEKVERQKKFMMLYEECKGVHHFDEVIYEPGTPIPPTIILQCIHCFLEVCYTTEGASWWSYRGEKYTMHEILNGGEKDEG